jgi:predicted  nucleic acid-binding Zn-ribbon protein
MTLDLTMAIAIIGCLLAVSAWIDSRRKAAMKEGEQKGTVARLREDLLGAERKIAALEERLRDSDGDVREIKSDVKHLIATLDRMADKLDKHLEEGK